MFGFFYNRLIYKYATLFGTMFNNIYVARYDSTFTDITKKIKVDIIWSDKEKYVEKISSESADRVVQVTFPRMGFSITGMQYDNLRKQNTVQRYATLNPGDTGTVFAAYQPVPYTLTFALNIHTRTIEDANQIIEQILPYFQTDYTPTLELLSLLEIPKDVKVSLESVTPQISAEGSMDEMRELVWVLTFNMQAFFFGPVANTKIIKTVIANVYDDSFQNRAAYLNLGSGNGIFAIGETVYQGASPGLATSTAEVLYFYNITGAKQLVIKHLKGELWLNTSIKSVTTNANYIFTSFEQTPDTVEVITVTPNPITANANSVYGITVSIDEHES